MKIQIEDTVYEGTAAGIMEQLRDLSFDPTEFPDVETQAAALLRHLERFGALTMLEV